MEILHHPFQPVFDKHSEILVLGSFPSPKSRENEFYYGEKSNRFWGMLADVFEKPLPESKEDKMRLLLGNGVALWDIVGECDDFKGASDNDIKNPKPNDISEIINACKIKRRYRVFINMPNICAFHNYDTFIRAQFPRQLPISDVNRINLFCAAPQHTISKPTGRRADVHGNTTAQIYVKLIQCLFKL